MKLTVLLVIVCVLTGLTWLVVGGHLSREATGLALGVVVGFVLGLVPSFVMLSAPRPEPHIVYRVAEPVEPQPLRDTSTALAVYRPQIKVRP